MYHKLLCPMLAICWASELMSPKVSDFLGLTRKFSVLSANNTQTDEFSALWWQTDGRSLRRPQGPYDASSARWPGFHARPLGQRPTSGRPLKRTSVGVPPSDCVWPPRGGRPASVPDVRRAPAPRRLAALGFALPLGAGTARSRPATPRSAAIRAANFAPPNFRRDLPAGSPRCPFARRPLIAAGASLSPFQGIRAETTSRRAPVHPACRLAKRGGRARPAQN